MFYNEVLWKYGSLLLEKIGKDPTQCLIGTEAEDCVLKLNSKSVKDWVALTDFKKNRYGEDTDFLEGSDGCLYELSSIIAIYFALLMLDVE